MAHPSVVINGVTYANTPEVNIPKSGGGTAKFYDTSEANITNADILNGKKGYGINGEVVGNIPVNGATGGTISTKAGTVTIPAGYTTGGSVSISTSSVNDCVSGNILAGKSILGVNGSLNVPTISQDATTKVLSIS